MTIQNDFLEFLNAPTCKKALFYMTIIAFSATALSELLNEPSDFMRRISEGLLIFWVARATKAGEKHADNIRHR